MTANTLFAVLGTIIEQTAAGALPLTGRVEGSDKLGTTSANGWKNVT
jgi:hypothetical protein